MDHQFKRLLNLVRRTGDRLVVTDPNGENTYVLMGLEAYEQLLDTGVSLGEGGKVGADDDFLDDYYDDDYDNEDFDVKPKWEIPDELASKNIWNVMPPAGDASETWNPEKFNDEEKKIIEEKFDKSVFSPKSDKKDDEPGEEQFYLEPVE